MPTRSREASDGRRRRSKGGCEQQRTRAVERGESPPGYSELDRGGAKDTATEAERQSGGQHGGQHGGRQVTTVHVLGVPVIRKTTVKSYEGKERT